MPEQTAQEIEAGIARRSGVEPFRSPQRGVSANSETEKSRAHAKEQLKMFDAGIYRFDPFSGENELQGDINAYINAKEMGEKDLAEKIRQKLLVKIKAKNRMKESGEWEEEGGKLAASEDIYNDINKGSRQRRMKFNPERNVPSSERDKVEHWTNTDPDARGPQETKTFLDESNNLHSWTESPKLYSKDQVSQWRKDIPEMHPNAKKRALNKLHSKTNVKKHPETGERMFQMWRGMSSDEYNSLKSKKFNKEYTSSWTPDLDVAQKFMKPKEGSIDSRDNYRLMSAWIPESQIHHIPNAIGEKKEAVDIGIGTVLKDRKNVGPSRLKQENEVIVKPHQLSVTGHGEFFNKVRSESNKPESAEIKEAKQRRDTQIANRSPQTKKYFENRAEFYGYKKSEKDISDIKKGSRQSRMKFNPDKVSDNERKRLDDWVHNRGSREDVPAMHPHAKKRGMDRLHKKTAVRKDPKTGERMFLLHRGMGNAEHENNSQGAKTSWTPYHHVADNFRKDAQMGEDEDTRELTTAHTKSAWIPESQIHHIATAIGGQDRTFGGSSGPEAVVRDEHEVIVHPHDFKYASKKATNRKEKVNSNINERAKLSNKYDKNPKRDPQKALEEKPFRASAESHKNKMVGNFNKTKIPKLAASERNVTKKM